MESQQQGYDCIYVYSCTGMHRLARVSSYRTVGLGGPWMVRAGVVKMDDFQASPTCPQCWVGLSEPLGQGFLKNHILRCRSCL